MRSGGNGVDKRINNSEGASVSTHESLFVYANSSDSSALPDTRQGISCAVWRNRIMAAARLLVRHRARRADLEMPLPWAHGGRAHRAPLDARKLKTMQVPVLFEASLASGLIGSFVGASARSLTASPHSCSTAWQGNFRPFIHLQELPT